MLDELKIAQARTRFSNEYPNQVNPIGRSVLTSPKKENDKLFADRIRGSGRVIGYSNTHGLCFEVVHKASHTGFYEPDELQTGD